MLALLVPFYVNGTLQPDERRRFDAALATDPELRSELAVALEIAGLVKAGAAGPSPAVSQNRLRALLSRIRFPALR